MAIVGSMAHQSTISINAVSYAIFRDTVQKRGTILDREGIRGARDHDVDDTREGQYVVSGQIGINPSATELATLWPFILGGAGPALAETLTTFELISERGNDVLTYNDCKIARASLSSSGGLLQLLLDIEGLTRADKDTDTAPAVPTQDRPFVLTDAVLTLVSAARQTAAFELVIDHALVTDRFMNSLTRVDLPEGDLIVTLATSHDQNATNAALFGQAVTGTTGTLVLTDDATIPNVHTITFGILQVPEEDPILEGKGPIELPLNMVARADGATPSIAVVITP